MAGATEQAKDAVQLAGQQVQSQVRELELLQTEIDRLKQAPVSVSEDAQNQFRIRQLEQDVLRVRQEINVALEIAEHEVQEVSRMSWFSSMARRKWHYVKSMTWLNALAQAVLTAQASLRGNEDHQYVDSQVVYLIQTQLFDGKCQPIMTLCFLCRLFRQALTPAATAWLLAQMFPLLLWLVLMVPPAQ